MNVIKLTIDVTKIDKSRLYKGKKGTYLNCSVILKGEPDQYGNDGFIVESISKDERESGKQGTILGNAVVVMKKPAEKVEQDDDDTLPF